MRTILTAALTTLCLVAPALLSDAAPPGKEPDPPRASSPKKESCMPVKESYGVMPDGAAVDQYTLANAAGLKVKLITYGAMITSVETPDRSGKLANVTLNLDALGDYVAGHPALGCIIGRYANRIAGARFTIDGVAYPLAANNGRNHIHGGRKGFHQYVWKAEPVEGQGLVGVRMSHESPDGDEGYPGRLAATVTYSLTDQNELKMEYAATTDKPTHVNLTNHAYWNLAGAGSGDVLGHQLMLNADCFLPVDRELIPLGKPRSARGTPMDFTRPQTIGARIDRLQGGYDHCYVLNRKPGEPPTLAARVVEPKSGRVMEVFTTEPGVQLYTANGMNLKHKSGTLRYGNHAGLCLEAQHFPDSPNRPEYPSTLLRPGETYRQTTIHKFSVQQESEQLETDPLVLKKLEWFQDQKLGLFMHWGIYSQWGCIESWPLVEVDKWARPDELRAWVERGKDFPRFFRDYQALSTTFNPQRFDPEKWAAAAKRGGMKYVVFTTKHHDGFSMFDTRQTDYRTTHPSCPFHANPRADAVKAVFDAFRKEGFGIGVYFSKADWHHPDYWSPDRPHPDRNVNYDTRREPEKWQRFVRFTHAQIEELLTGYGPVDILWLDAGQVRPPAQDIDMPRLAAMARRHQPGLIIVDRTVKGRYENYRTPEQEVPEKALPYVWETCMTMGDQWSYKPGDRYKSTHKLVHLLVDIAAKGGNFLLNVGPNPDGELPAEAAGRLNELGAWMEVNGEAIYGTRAVAPYKEGRTCLTQKDAKLYLIYLGDEGQPGPPAEITVAAAGRARSVRMLGAKQPVEWQVDAARGLTIRVPQALRTSPPCRHAWAFEVNGGR